MTPDAVAHPLPPPVTTLSKSELPLKSLFT